MMDTPLYIWVVQERMQRMPVWFPLNQDFPPPVSLTLVTNADNLDSVAEKPFKQMLSHTLLK